jgi:hypothetical protein
MFIATCAMISTISASEWPAARTASTSARLTWPVFSTSARANVSAAPAFGSEDRPSRFASISWLSSPTLRPIAVCAETQYWQAFCSATASAMRSRVFGSSTPAPSMPCRPGKALSAAGEFASTRMKFGTMPRPA